jgi:hypothetical protein
VERLQRVVNSANEVSKRVGKLMQLSDCEIVFVFCNCFKFFT